MTVNTIINLIRSTAKERDASLGIYTDKYLWELFLLAKATVLKNKLASFNVVNSQNYHTFCIELVEAYSHECGCSIPGCKVLKSKYPLPRFICGRNTCSLTVMSLDYSETIDLVVEEYLLEALLDDMKKGNKLHSVVNNNLVIWNSPPLQGVQLRALWEDVTNWDDIQLCEKTTDCIDVYSLDLGLDRNLIDMAIDLLFKRLSLPKGIPDDLTNDSSDTIRQ